jgi:type IV secretory pathway TrbL component
MSIDLIILIAALFVAWLIFNWLINVVKASFSTAITIAVVVLILQLVFGIGPQDLWQQIVDLPQTLFNEGVPVNSN